MLEYSRIPKTHDVALEPVEVEASAIEEGRRRSFVVLPQVGEPLAGKAIRAHVEASIIPTALGDSFAAYLQEVRVLMNLQDRFGGSPTFLARLSGILGYIDNSQAAVDFARQAVKSSDSPVFSYRLGEALLNNGDKRAAREIFEVLAQDGHIDSLLRLAELSINAQDFNQALAVLNTALSRDELDWRVRLLAGTLSLVRNEYQEAIRHYRVALDDKQNSSVIYLNIGIAYYLIGLTDKALRETKKALRINPWCKNAVVFFADLGLREDRELEPAKNYLIQYLSLKTAEKPLVKRLADIYFKTSNFSEGISLLESVKLSFNDAGVWNNLGVLWSLREPRRAQKYFYKAVESVGGIVEAHDNRAASIAVLNFAHTLLETQKNRAAEQILTEFINSAPSNEYLSDSVLWKFPLYLCRVLMLQDKAEQAAQLAYQFLNEPALHLDGRLDLVSSLMAYHSFITSDLSAALEYARLGYKLSMDVKNKDDFRVNMAVNNMAFILLELEMLDEAEPFVRQLKTVGLYSEFAIATKGLFALKLGFYERGMKYYELAVATAVGAERKNAIRQKMNLEMGRFWLKKGERQKAIRCLKKIVGAKEIRDVMRLDVLRRAAISLLENMGSDRAPKG